MSQHFRKNPDLFDLTPFRDLALVTKRTGTEETPTHIAIVSTIVSVDSFRADFGSVCLSHLTYTLQLNDELNAHMNSHNSRLFSCSIRN